MVTTDRDQALDGDRPAAFWISGQPGAATVHLPRADHLDDLAYFYHLINIPLVACSSMSGAPGASFREMMSGIMVVSFFGLMGYLLVPAIGPSIPCAINTLCPCINRSGLLNREVDFMDFARIRRDVFPSLHVAISFVAWLYAYRNSKRLFWILSPLILSLWLSTLYLRYHYLIDVVAGLILAPLSFCSWPIGSSAAWVIYPISLPIPASWAERLPWLPKRPPCAA